MKNLILLIVAFTTVHIVCAQTWVRQNPFPKLVELLDIDFDGPYGLAVGQESLCFTTVNYGVSWQPRRLPIEGYTYDAAYVVPGTNGQVLYAGGIDLIVSQDGGHTWDQAHAGVGQIQKIQSLPGGGIMVHSSFLSVYTLDNGTTWDAVTLPGEGVSTAHFTDIQHGWAESGNFNNSQVWVTTDGGMSWNVRDTLRHPVINSIQMLNEQVGFMAARDFVYKTTDGGHHWIALHSNPVNSVQDMHVVNENEIWTCLISGFIFYTRDGGNQWSEADPAIISSNKTNGIYANADGEVWATGKFVSILHSPDETLTWTDQIPNSKSIMYQPHFLNEEQGLVGGSAGNILWTQNGGASWDILRLGINENFFAVQMLNAQSAVVGSSSGSVFTTTNGGQDWQEIGENFGQVTDIHAFSANEILAIAESGNIWRTDDGGINWINVHNATSGLLQGLHFFDDQRGWACGWFGQILHTTDGGITWTPQATNSNAQFSDIHFTSATHGWVVSSAFIDSVWHTSDGGVTWEGMKIPFSLFWHGVSFHSPDTGWIAGGSAGSGTIIRTNDGGQTWTWDHQSPEGLFGIHAVPGKETVWGSGVGGNIVKYSPCTFIPDITSLTGPLTPCQKDTVTYEASFNDVDEFIWSFPADWLVFGNTNTSSIQLIIGTLQGEVSVYGRDVCGNESALRMILATPIPVTDVLITENGAFLECDMAGAQYQWLQNGIPIPGANEQIFAPGASGSFAVIVTQALGCEVRSNTIQFVVTRLDQPHLGELIVYPNPATDWVTVIPKNDFPIDFEKCSFFNLEGRILQETNLQDGRLVVKDFASGMYILEVRIDGRIWRGKVILGKK